MASQFLMKRRSVNAGELMNAHGVLVTRVNAKTSATELNKAFKHCGDIMRLSLQKSVDGFGAEAIVIFESEIAVKLALLLRNLIIDNTAVVIEELPVSYPLPRASCCLNHIARRPSMDTDMTFESVMFDLASDGYEIDEQTLSEMGTSENAKRRKSIVDNVGIASVQQRQQQQQQQQQHQHQPSLPLHQGVAVGVAGRSTRTQQGSDESLEIYSSDLSLSGTSPMADGAVTLLSPSLPLHQSDPGDSSSYYSFGPPSSPPLTLARSLSPSSLSPSPYRTIDYRDIKFVSGTPIGRGAFGVVYAAEWRGTKVAVKQLLTFIGAEELAILQVECALLQHCSNHPNVVKFVGACLEGGSFHIVTAFCAGGSVHDAFIVRREPFSNAETLRILRDSACGIMHLHKENVIHRDIAARNFLLDENNNVFVTDFGLARVKTAAYQHTQSSMGPVKYMAPESIALKRYCEHSDAFSFGVYIWEVMHRCEPYRGVEVNFEMMAGIVNGTLRLSIDATITNDFLSDLMQECWCSDPLARPSFTSILERLRN